MIRRSVNCSYWLRAETLASQGEDSLFEIEDEGSGDRDGGEEGVCAAVIAHGDTSPVLDFWQTYSRFCAAFYKVSCHSGCDIYGFLRGAGYRVYCAWLSRLF